MKKLTIVHGPQARGKTTSAQAIMRELQADCIHDSGVSFHSLVRETDTVIELLSRNDHVVMLVSDDVFGAIRLMIQRELNNHPSLNQTEVHYRRFGGVMRCIADRAEAVPAGKSKLPVAVIIYSEERGIDAEGLKELARKVRCDVIQHDNSCQILDHIWPPRRSAFVTANVDHMKDQLMRNVTNRGENPEDMRIELYRMDDLLPEVNGAKVLDRFPGQHDKWATPVLFPGSKMSTAPLRFHAPADFPLAHINASVRGVAHGATMYAMGIAEGLLLGGQQVTIVVDGDDEAKALAEQYPFIQWDCGRVRVRTVSEVMMVAAEAGKGTLGMTAWVVDVKPASLNALLELQQWESFTAVLSGPNFDDFKKGRSA